MPRHQEELFRAFERRIYGPSFKQLSGWDHPVVPLGAHSIVITLNPAEMSRYNYEHELPNSAVAEAVANVRKTLQHDYSIVVTADDIVLAPSLTAAISVVLHWVRSRGMTLVVADAPYYFSYLNVTERLGMDFVVPKRTVESRDDIRPLLDTMRRSSSPRAVVVCDPRYILGSNYSRPELQAVHGELCADDVLIVDHAMDVQRNSSVAAPSSCPVIRLFSFGKTVAMNGARMAALVAPTVAGKLRTVAGAVFGSHDIAALKLLSALLINTRYMTYQRESVMNIVRENHLRYAAAYSKAHKITFHRPENGILGYAILDVTGCGRYELYQRLMNNGVHAMFGQHFGIDSAGLTDLLRINYLLDCRPALDVVAAALSG